MKKRFLTILLVTTMVFSLVGCGSNSETEVSEQASVSEVESTVESVEEVEEQATVEVESVEEQTEENVPAETKLEGFQYQLTLEKDGTQKVIGMNTPDGYERESTINNNYKFVNVKNDYFMISEFTVENMGEGPVEAYENYLATGEWTGLYDFATEELLNERTVEVPGGTATIITAVCEDLYKTQNVFIDFDGYLAHGSMNLELDFYIDEGGVVNGSEEEFRVDEVLAQLFVESDNTEYLYPISETTVEFNEGTYEYELSYYDIENENTVAYMGFNLPEGDFEQSEDDIAMNEEYGQYGISNYEFTDSNGNMLVIAETDGTGSPYETVCVYRHFLRTGEMTEGVEDVFFGEGGWMDMHTGTLVDMQLGETVETTYGSVNIVKGLWQYDIMTEVTETVIFEVNDREMFVTLHNKNAEPGVTLDSYEGQLAGMLAEMF